MLDRNIRLGSLLVSFALACSGSGEGEGDGASSSGGVDAEGVSAAGASGAGGTSSTGGSGTGAAPSTGGSGTGAAPSTGGASTFSDGGTLEPPPGEFGERAELREGNSEAAAAQIGSKIYVVGGYPSTRQVQTTVQVYDATVDRWDLGVPLPTAVHHPMAVGVDGKLYVIGGEIGDGGGPATAESNVFDPALDDWSPLPDMPTARSAGAAAAIGNVIYVVGGRPPAGNAFESFDIGENRWTADLPRPSLAANDRNHLISVALDGKIYVAGGRYDGGGFSSPLTDLVEVYDPATNAWTEVRPLLRPRGGVNGVVANGCFYVWGGEGANTGEPNNVFPDFDVYDPGANVWMPLDPLPIPVHGMTGAAFIDGLIYIPGGGTNQGGSSGSTFHQVYRPSMTCD